MNTKNLTLHIGRITATPNITNGTQVSFSIAVDDSYMDNNIKMERAYFFNVVMFKANSFLLENLKKGTLITVGGKLTQSTYKDNSGDTKQSISIVASSITVLRQPKGTTELSEEYTYDQES